MSSNQLSVVIPVFNEKATLAEILCRVLSVTLPGLSRVVILVDDFSTDGTRELLANIPELVGDLASTATINVLFQEKNQGKGAALRRGFAEATGAIHCPGPGR